MYPKYVMSFSNGMSFIMSAKKRGGSKTSNYMMSASMDNFDPKSEFCLGKVRSNFMGTEFLIYDNGKNPKKTKNMHECRQELGIVYYDATFMRGKTPRKMRVFTPEIDEDGNILEWRPMNEMERLSNFVKMEKFDKLKNFVNTILVGTLKSAPMCSTSVEGSRNPP